MKFSVNCIINSIISFYLPIFLLQLIPLHWSHLLSNQNPFSFPSPFPNLDSPKRHVLLQIFFLACDEFWCCSQKICPPSALPTFSMQSRQHFWRRTIGGTFSSVSKKKTILPEKCYECLLFLTHYCLKIFFHQILRLNLRIISYRLPTNRRSAHRKLFPWSLLILQRIFGNAIDISTLRQ